MICSEFCETCVRSASDLVQASLNWSDSACEKLGNISPRDPALRITNGLSPNDMGAAPLLFACLTYWMQQGGSRGAKHRPASRCHNNGCRVCPYHSAGSASDLSSCFRSLLGFQEHWL